MIACHSVKFFSDFSIFQSVQLHAQMIIHHSVKFFPILVSFKVLDVQ